MGLVRKRDYPMFLPPKFGDAAAARLGYSVTWEDGWLRLEKDTGTSTLVIEWNAIKGWDAYVWHPYTRSGSEIGELLRDLAQLGEDAKEMEIRIKWKRH